MSYRSYTEACKILSSLTPTDMERELADIRRILKRIRRASDYEGEGTNDSYVSLVAISSSERKILAKTGVAAADYLASRRAGSLQGVDLFAALPSRDTSTGRGPKPAAFGLTDSQLAIARATGVSPRALSAAKARPLEGRNLFEK